MGMIHINRNRQSLGQYSEQDVADGLQSGQFRPDDLAWQEPMESWQPLSSFTNLPPASPAAFVSLPAPEAAPATGPAPAWESPEPGPFFRKAVESVKEIFSKPVETFQAMPTEGGIAKPLKFYIFVSWLTGAVAMLYQAAASMINPAMFAGDQAKNLPQYALLLIFGVVIVFFPLFLLLGSFISSGILHVALKLVGGARMPFETTFRVFCYASGATSTLQLIPLCGGWLYSISSLVYCVIGLKEAHRTDLWRPVVAILLVFLLCCGVILGFTMLAVTLGYSAMGTAGK